MVIASPRLGQASENGAARARPTVSKSVSENFVPKTRLRSANLGLGLDAVVPALLAHDVVFRIVEVVFVLDVADDLLEHVLDGHQPGDPPPYSSTTIAMWFAVSRGIRAAARSGAWTRGTNTAGLNMSRTLNSSSPA